MDPHAGYAAAIVVGQKNRTDIPGRCRFVSNYSLKGRDGEPPAHLEYLDELPFPRAQLKARRAVFCGYCFFGGPTKTQPLS